MTIDKNIALTDNILNMDNVLGITHGTKFVAGEDTGIPCVVVEVKQKLSQRALSPDNVIPTMLSDGSTMTDVVVGDECYAQGCCPTTPAAGCPGHTATHGAIKGGTKISNNVSNSYGTLGAIVRDQTTGRLLGLTNAHVATVVSDNQGYDWVTNPSGISDYGDPTKVPVDEATALGRMIHHPASWVAGNKVLGPILRTKPIRFNQAGASTLANYVDASVIDLSTGYSTGMLPCPVPHDSKILGATANTAPIYDFSELNDINTQNVCIKIGTRTGRLPMPPDAEYDSSNGHVTAVIDDVDYSANIRFVSGSTEPEWTASFIHCIRIKLDNYSNASSPGWVFSAAGDSGSCVWIWSASRSRWEVLGLIFAGSGTEASSRSIVCRMDYILKSLNIGEGWTDGGNYLGNTLDEHLSPGQGGTYTTPLSDVSDATSLWDGSITVPSPKNGGSYSKQTMPEMQMHWESTFDTDESWISNTTCYKVAGSVNSTTKLTHQIDGSNISTQPCHSYVVDVSDSTGSNRYTLNGATRPEVHIKPEVAYTLHLGAESMIGGSHPLIIEKFPSGAVDGPFNTPTVTLSATTTEATSSWWRYSCTVHGTGMGNKIFM